MTDLRLALASCTHEGSIGSRIRRARTEKLKKVINTMSLFQEHLEILDVGGTPEFWSRAGFTGSERARITLLNPDFEPGKPYFIEGADGDYFRLASGDGRDMAGFEDGNFDLVFSNSVIEHIPEWEGQKRFAHEIMRVGKHWIVQTPNRNFPFDSHYMVPFYQFMPEKMKVMALKYFATGAAGRKSDYAELLKIATSIKLLKKHEMDLLFPKGVILHETILGFTHSLVAMGGSTWLLPYIYLIWRHGIDVPSVVNNKVWQ